MKRFSRSTATLAAMVLTASGLLALSTAPAQADNVNAPPLRSVGGPASGLSGPFSATRTAGGTWVSQNNRLLLFANNANGDAAPLRTLTGPSTGLGAAYAVTTDSAGRLYVANGTSIRVFAASASGDAAPSRVISGLNTQLVLPTGVALDRQGNIYVADYDGLAIRVFAPGASGNATPIRVIQGVSTGLSKPLHLTVVGKRIWVANYTGSSVTAYPTSADGNVPPVVSISGASTGLGQVRGVALDSGGNIYVANGPRISFFSAGSQDNVAPQRVLTGPATGLSGPFSIQVNAANQIMTPDQGVNRYFTFNPLIAPLTPPSKVRALKVKGKVGAAKRAVVWKKVSDDGGSALLGQQVKVSQRGKVYLTRSVGKKATRTVLKRSKLHRGKNMVWVRARNAIGYGPWVTKKFRVRK